VHSMPSSSRTRIHCVAGSRPGRFTSAGRSGQVWISFDSYAAPRSVVRVSSLMCLPIAAWLSPQMLARRADGIEDYLPVSSGESAPNHAAAEPVVLYVAERCGT
jgi:hypothetical protein